MISSPSPGTVRWPQGRRASLRRRGPPRAGSARRRPGVGASFRYHDVAGAVGLATAMEAAPADRSRFRSQVGQIPDSPRAILAGVPDAVLNTPSFAPLLPPPQHEIPRRAQRDTADAPRSCRSGGIGRMACQSGAPPRSPRHRAMRLSPRRLEEVSVSASAGTARPMRQWMLLPSSSTR